MFPECDANLGEPIIKMVPVDPSNPEPCAIGWCKPQDAQDIAAPGETRLYGIGQVSTREYGVICLQCARRTYFARIGWRLWIAHAGRQLRYFVSYDIKHGVKHVMCSNCGFDGLHPDQCVPVTQKECERCKEAGVTCAIILPNIPANSGYSSELADGII